MIPEDMIESLIPVILTIDQHLPAIVSEYGIWTYVILFLIIFFETGLVITPFLPGDSLLFVGGAAAAGGVLDVQLLLIAVIAGAILGDTLNYWIGNRIGLHFFLERFPGLVKKEHLDRTHEFFETYGGATIVVARFVPMVRSFAPCLAGIGSMEYRRFLVYNVLGAMLWAFAIVLAGYYLGTLTIVKENMSLLMLGVIALTVGCIIFLCFSLVCAWRKREKKPET